MRKPKKRRKAMKKIRFIDTNYHTLFEIEDGDAIFIKSAKDEKTAVCCYIDDYHFQIDGRTFHILQFAKCMEQNGLQVEPV